MRIQRPFKTRCRQFLVVVMIMGMYGCASLDSSDWQLRKKAVEKLDDQQMLAEVAMNDQVSEVRLAAVERLTDQVQLAKVVSFPSPNTNLRLAAIEKLTDQTVLADIAAKDMDVDVCGAAAKRLTDQSGLAEVAVEGIHAEVRHTVVEKLSDEAVLATVASEDDNSDVCRAALRKLTDETVIASVALKNKNSEICVEAVERLTDQVILAKVGTEGIHADVRKAAVEKLTGLEVLEEIAMAETNGEVCAFATRRFLKRLEESPIAAYRVARGKTSSVRIDAAVEERAGRFDLKYTPILGMVAIDSHPRRKTVGTQNDDRAASNFVAFKKKGVLFTVDVDGELKLLENSTISGQVSNIFDNYESFRPDLKTGVVLAVDMQRVSNHEEAVGVHTSLFESISRVAGGNPQPQYMPPHKISFLERLSRSGRSYSTKQYDLYMMWLSVMSENSREAATELEELCWARVEGGDVSDHRLFLEGFPDGKYAIEGEKRIEEISWEAAQEEGDSSSYDRFIKEFPEGIHLSAARSAKAAAEKAEYLEALEQSLYHATDDSRLRRIIADIKEPQIRETVLINAIRSVFEKKLSYSIGTRATELVGVSSEERRQHVSVIKTLLELGVAPDSLRVAGYRAGGPRAVTAYSAGGSRAGLDFTIIASSEPGKIVGADSEGITALCIAVLNNDRDVSELLISAGANVNAVDSDGNTLLSIAVKNGEDSIVSLLKAKGARLK